MVPVARTRICTPKAGLGLEWFGRRVHREQLFLQKSQGIVEDYKEACLVLSDSPKASAALSRRCLQNLLRGAAGVKPGDLSIEIQQVYTAEAAGPHSGQH